MADKVLVIGSTVADVVIHVDRLPKTAEDVHVLGQRTQLGGCAFNVSDILRHTGVPHLLFSPVGSGIYGDFVRRELDARAIGRVLPDQPEPNGCCYCFVEASGERTFVCDHGAEYRFKPEFFGRIDPLEFGAAYVCGLEIEEPSGSAIIDFLAAHPHLRIYFAPGPRIRNLDPARMSALFALHPVLHLNEQEAREYTGFGVKSAAEALHEQTRSDVVVTLGERGAYCLSDGCGEWIGGERAEVQDTIGAGDAHMGALIAFRALGWSLPDAVRAANRVGARVVSRPGALISKPDFDELGLM